MIQAAALLAAGGVLLCAVLAVARMHAGTRAMVRIMYVVIACGAFATLFSVARAACEPLDVVDLAVWSGLLMLMLGQRRKAWQVRPAELGSNAVPRGPGSA